MCDTCALPRSGRKEDVFSRLVRFRCARAAVAKVWRCWRRSRLRICMQARGPAVDNRKLCTNQEDIAELRPVAQIPRQRFVSCAQPRGTRGDAVIYGLDVSSAQNLIVRRLPWPWDRGTIPHSFRAAVIVLCRELGMISRVEGSTIRRRAARACDSDRAVERLHSALNAAGHVVDPEWFSGMTLAASFRFLHELRQVRMSLIEAIERCPEDQLEGIWETDLGDRYWALVRSGIQKEAKA